MQLGLGVEVVVVVVDVLQVVLVYLVAIEATFQVLTACELSHKVQLTPMSVFLKQNPQQL